MVHLIFFYSFSLNITIKIVSIQINSIRNVKGTISIDNFVKD